MQERVVDRTDEELVTSSMSWTDYFFEMAILAARKSKDPSTKVGCVIVDENRVVATGYNGFPHGVRDYVSRYDNRDLKYAMVVHAELNAVCYAARAGVSLDCAHAYITFPPCNICAAAMIQANIIEVSWLKIPHGHVTTEKWQKAHEIALMMFNEARVIVREYDREV